MQKIFLLIISSILCFNCFANSNVQPDPTYAGTMWYNLVEGELNHDSFIRFDRNTAICTIGFMGAGEPSEIFDFVYNLNNQNELILCRINEPMRPVVILKILENNTLEFNLLDLPVGNKYRKIQYKDH